jgi:hypothetical protein
MMQMMVGYAVRAFAHADGRLVDAWAKALTVLPRSQVRQALLPTLRN